MRRPPATTATFPPPEHRAPLQQPTTTTAGPPATTPTAAARHPPTRPKNTPATAPVLPCRTRPTPQLPCTCSDFTHRGRHRTRGRLPAGAGRPPRRASTRPRASRSNPCGLRNTSGSRPAKKTSTTPAPQPGEAGVATNAERSRLLINHSGPPASDRRPWHSPRTMARSAGRVNRPPRRRTTPREARQRPVPPDGSVRG